MGLGIEDDFVEVNRAGVRKKQIEVFKRFCEDKAFHLIAFCFRNYVFKGGVAGVGSLAGFDVDAGSDEAN